MFHSRVEAGRLLAGRIAQRGFRQPVILTLPGPGVTVAVELAHSLQAPLDVVVPFAEGHGAVQDTCECTGWVESTDSVARGGAGVERLRDRERALRRGRPPLELAGQTCLLADDGSASVADLRSALHRLKSAHPRRVLLATPIVRSTALAELRDELDGCIHLFEIVDEDELALAFQEPGAHGESEIADVLERVWRNGSG